MEKINRLEQLISSIKQYAENWSDIALLKIQDRLSDVFSSIASAIIIGIISLFIIFFASVGVAWWIGQALDNPSLGFFCIAGFYLVLAVVIFFYRDKWIKLPLINSLLKKININEEG
jgi:ABC-type multidrug transport system fused ATPase/permease subunit